MAKPRLYQQVKVDMFQIHLMHDFLHSAAEKMDLDQLMRSVYEVSADIQKVF